MPSDSVHTPPPEETQYSRFSSSQAAADAIPILVDDTYHVFHLTTPPYTIHHPPRLRSFWSRLRSTDLKTWARDDSPAISPSTDPSAPDADGAWTGSAVLGPDGNMHIFYTGYNLSQNGRQVIIQASAPDRHGSRFSKSTRPISIESPASSLAAFEDIDFRDPYVFFNEQEGEYWMILATRLAKGPFWTRGCIALLTSKDLNSWTVCPDPLYTPNDMHCPECPELFSLPNGKWYLVYSRFAAPNAGTVYRVADFPRGPFRVPRDGSNGRLDGRRWYAAKSCQKAGDPSKRVYFGWIADRYAGDGKWLWGGDMGIPRELSANPDGTLRIEPAPGVLEAALAAATHGPSNLLISSSLCLSSIGTTSVQFMDEILPSHIGSDAYLLELRVGAHDAKSFGILLRADDNMRGHRIQFIPNTDGTFTVLLLVDLAPLDDFWADQYKLYIPRYVDGPEIVRHERVTIDGPVRLLVQGDVLQCFCGGRSICFRLPARSNPPVHVEAPEAPAHELGFFVEDGDVHFSDMTLKGVNATLL